MEPSLLLEERSKYGGTVVFWFLPSLWTQLFTLAPESLTLSKKGCVAPARPVTSSYVQPRVHAHAQASYDR